MMNYLREANKIKQNSESDQLILLLKKMRPKNWLILVMLIYFNLLIFSCFLVVS